MSTYDEIIALCNSQNIKPTVLEAKLGMGRGYIGKLKKANANPSTKSLQKIADYFNVSVDYLINGKEGEDYEADLKKSRDLKVQFDQIRRLLQTSKMQPLYFDGQEVDQESIDLLMKQVEVSFAIIQRATE